MSPAVQAALGSWSVPPWITLALLLTAVIYDRGWRQLQQTRRMQFPRWRQLSFLCGLGTVWLAVASPLDALGGFLLFMHMAQHLVLMSVAPPLILLGSPTVPMLRGLPRIVVRNVIGPFLGMRALHRLGRFLTRPAVCWLAMVLAYLGWHITLAYELALRSPGWHEVEHACFLLTCILFWWPVVLPWPSAAHGSRWILLPYLVSADLVNTGLSAFLCFAGRVVYPTYTLVPRIFAITALQDQIAAGALMWVLGSTIFLLPAGYITLQLLSPQLKSTHPQATIPAASRGASRRIFDLLRVPVIGRLLRARYGRLSLQAVSFVVAAVVIADGFRGHQMGSMNLAGIVPWTFARALGVLALLSAGNLFCMACPFTLPRELAARLGLNTRAWPNWLRSKWLSAGLLIFLFWMFEAFSFWDHPFRTAWIVILYFVAAFVTDTFFRGASFCKYVCPIGQFNFVSSLLSPLELKSRSQATCSSCRTHDCIAGNQHQRGCELQLFVPQKVGNLDCTLCMDCVKACPHDNIVIIASAPARDLLHDPVRSSIGRLSGRADIAAVALVIVCAAFASAAVMVAPVEALLGRLSTSISPGTGLALSLAGAFLLPAALAGLNTLAGMLTRYMARGAISLRPIFCRFAFALLPLGLSMWASHLSFHLLTGWSTLSPAIHQAAIDFGARGIAPAQWMSTPAVLTAAHLLNLQLSILAGGLLVSLYCGWRAVRAMPLNFGRSVVAMFPWAALTCALYLAGVSILLQPMQMRNMVHR